MQDSRLLSIINQLEKQEIRELKLFLRSPFFNQREDVVQAFDFITERLYVLKMIPDKADLFRAVYPGEAIDIQQSRYLMSWLLKLIEQYLSLKPVLEKEADLQTQLAGTYRARRMNKHFRRVLKKLQTRRQQSAIRDAEYYDLSYHIQLEEYRFTSSQKRLTEHNLQEISDTIDVAYLARKLRQTCLLLSHQAVYQKEYDFGLLDKSMVYIKERGLLDIPAISVYYYCYLALAGLERETNFRQFKQLLFDEGHRFTVGELRDLYLLAINYCIRRLNAGQEAYAREGLELYKSGFESNILTSNRSISRFTYRNTLAMALKVGELQWAEQFIHQYRNYLDRHHRESMYSFSLARLAYRKQEYGKVLELLQKADYEDPLLNLAAKTMLLKVYYESQEYELLQAHLDAMRSYIHRKRVIGYHRTNYLNIIRYARRLIGVNPYDHEALRSLRQKVKSEEVLTEREWLLKQVEETGS